jgi:hypothetical protein
VFDLPRSILLAAWGTAVLTGEATAEDAVAAVSSEDEPHRIDVHWGDLGSPGFTGSSAIPGVADPDGVGLADLLHRLVEVGVPGLRAVLPAPGDVVGLPGPPDFNRLALAAGECVLTEPARHEWASALGCGGLVPEVTEFGSAWEPGAMVTWAVLPVRLNPAAAAESLADAERALRTALASTTDTLTRLEVARWREDAADRVAAARDGSLSRRALPPSAPPRSVQVLATAARVRAIVTIAREDDGAAVTGHEAEQRARALRELDGVSRRAMAAAVNGLLEPRR